MSAPHADQLVSEYLDRLGQRLTDVPPTRREEILDEITHHIAEERGRLHEESDADVRNLLDRIGDPADVAAAARDEADGAVARPRRAIGPVEVLALVLTPLIWPAGVILLWLSPAWNTRDKLIGTLLPPGGYLFLVFLPGLLLLNVSTCTSGGNSSGNSSQSCTGFLALPVWQQDVVNVALVGGLLLLLVLPILTAIYLARQLNKWRSSEG